MIEPVCGFGFKIQHRFLSPPPSSPRNQAQLIGILLLGSKIFHSALPPWVYYFFSVKKKMPGPCCYSKLLFWQVRESRNWKDYINLIISVRYELNFPAGLVAWLEGLKKRVRVGEGNESSWPQKILGSMRSEIGELQICNWVSQYGSGIFCRRVPTYIEIILWKQYCHKGRVEIMSDLGSFRASKT